MAKTADIVTSGAANQVHTYSYVARNNESKQVTGTAKALCRSDVVHELLRRGLTPLSIKGGPESGGGAVDIQFRKSAKKRDLVVTTRQLASMFDAGMNYVQAFDIVQADTEDPTLASGLNEVKLAIQQGSKLSEALAAQGDLFPPSMINLITAGEAGGQVKDAMNRVADQLDSEDRLAAKVKKAMMYPMVVAVISIVIFAVMMLVLVPKFSATFDDLGAELPAMTKAVVAISDWSVVGMPILLVLTIPTFLWYRTQKNKTYMREFMDPKKLKLPVFGTSSTRSPWHVSAATCPVSSMPVSSNSKPWRSPPRRSATFTWSVP